MTRGERNNNPGNIRIGAPWEGLMPVDEMNEAQAAESEFCVFKAPVWGIRAIARTLITYADSRLARDGSRIDTVQEVIDRWAPPNENNTEAYASHVRQLLAVDRGEKINIKEYGTCKALVKSIIKHECRGLEYPDEVIDNGLRRAGIEVPPKSLAKSKTVAGAATAGAATAAAPVVDTVVSTIQDNIDVATETTQKLMPYMDAMQNWFVFLTVLGLGLVIYARWKDRDHK